MDVRLLKCLLINSSKKRYMIRSISSTRSLLVALALFLSVLGLKAQSAFTSCEGPQFVCEDTSFSYTCAGAGACNCTLYFWFHVTTPVTSVTVSTGGTFTGYTLYGVFQQPDAFCAIEANPSSPVVSSQTVNTSTITLTSGPSLAVGYYYLKVTTNTCGSTVSFQTQGGTLECPTLPCEDCIGTFAPEPGKKYLISLWVREENATPTTTTFTKPNVYLDFVTGSGTVTLGPFVAAGQIIDGWQRLEQEFTVPANATAFSIRLECTTGNCLFDDIRVQPFDGSMKTYVFDPVTLRLAAELDERNYATYYEYDEEGKLVRIKKETAKGIMTIQESKTGIKKE